MSVDVWPVDSPNVSATARRRLMSVIAKIRIGMATLMAGRSEREDVCGRVTFVAFIPYSNP